MFIDLFAPFACPCVLCGRASGQGLCKPCRARLDHHLSLDTPPCRCGLPRVEAASGDEPPAGPPAPLCGRCIGHPPPFQAAYCGWFYAFPLDRLISAYKHHGRLDVERALDTLIRDQPLPWPEADLLCPLPTHWRRRLTRGFDQAERLALGLGRHWRRPVAPLLIRHRATPHQQGLGRAHRVRNLRHAFVARAESRHRRILLIDDVMTTGSSARAASRALLEAGAAEVRVWALARTLEHP